MPPCPYPTTTHRPSIVEVLSPRPQQAYVTLDTPSEQFMDLPTAFSTMNLQPPDPTWYIDSRETSHMTSDTGTLHTISKSTTVNSIHVGDGNRIPLTSSTLHLSNVLHTPHIIKNLISVRQFTKDNHVFIEFDPYGFFVNDLRTGVTIMRCNSSGELYPVSNLHRSTSSPPVSLTTISSQIWYQRLGHPGNHIFSFLRKLRSHSLCSSCQIAKHVCVPFTTSMSRTLAPFDIIHSDLWTSLVLSSGGFLWVPNQSNQEHLDFI
ncbi:hypothetical protein OSB04_006417 [Centaurea solstitialis]|uniref:Retrovirus-related Pol polyprotein from transposon TNT 1-94-like beta-barrel domain-containing protein n=1 Tax=Centaurea solstitialis TaxID=347529 RepID=A0AA38WHN0_9ASTR|nr:hypothetical protein OSB04_006417 [Centaurea solstitialis]